MKSEDQKTGDEVIRIGRQEIATELSQPAHAERIPVPIFSLFCQIDQRPADDRRDRSGI